MGNTLTAQYACSDLADPAQQQNIPIDVLYAPIVPLFAFNPVALSSTSSLLFFLCWGILALIVSLNYWVLPQYFGNSWTQPNKEFYIAALFGFLYYYLFMIVVVYLPFRPAACTYSLNSVQRLLDPTRGPSVPLSQAKIYEKLRAFKLSQGLPVPPAPLFYEP